MKMYNFSKSKRKMLFWIW